MWRLYISRSYFFGGSFINKPSTILALNKLLTDQSYKWKNKKKRWRFPQNYFPKFTLILYPSDKTEKFTKIVVDQFDFWNVEISVFHERESFMANRVTSVFFHDKFPETLSWRYRGHFVKLWFKDSLWQTIVRLSARNIRFKSIETEQRAREVSKRNCDST